MLQKTSFVNDIAFDTGPDYNKFRPTHISSALFGRIFTFAADGSAYNDILEESMSDRLCLVSDVV